MSRPIVTHSKPSPSASPSAFSTPGNGGGSASGSASGNGAGKPSQSSQMSAAPNRPATATATATAVAPSKPLRAANTTAASSGAKPSLVSFPKPTLSSTSTTASYAQQQLAPSRPPPATGSSSLGLASGTVSGTASGSDSSSSTAGSLGSAPRSNGSTALHRHASSPSPSALAAVTQRQSPSRPPPPSSSSSSLSPSGGGGGAAASSSSAPRTRPPPPTASSSRAASSPNLFATAAAQQPPQRPSPTPTPSSSAGPAAGPAPPAASPPSESIVYIPRKERPASVATTGLSAFITGYEKRTDAYTNSKFFVFIVEVSHPSEEPVLIYRRYAQFREFHRKIAKQFGGINELDQNAISIPGVPIIKENVFTDYEKACDDLNEFLQELLILPHAVVSCDVLRMFFTPTAKDVAAKQAADMFSGAEGSDSSGILTAEVVDFRKVFDPDKFYVYLIEAKRRDGSLVYVLRRYSEFFELNEKLSESFPEFKAQTTAALPDKIFLGRSQTKEVAAKRVKKLDYFFQTVLAIPALKESPVLHNFLTPSYKDALYIQQIEKLASTGGTVPSGFSL